MIALGSARIAPSSASPATGLCVRGHLKLTHLGHQKLTHPGPMAAGRGQSARIG
jgi:hypothetical protein